MDGPSSGSSASMCPPRWAMCSRRSRAAPRRASWCPLAVVAALALVVARRWFEALLLGGSLLAAALLVYALKVIVGRTRPDFWEPQCYWGSSFPSGHTLNVAAFSTAAALCVARIWPRHATLAMSLAFLWTGAVAISRLVLGVHWSSEVLAAICLGAFIPLLARVVLELRRRPS